MMAPLILTLALDPVSQARFDRLREAHFPPERNKLAAHLTLFHALNGVREADIRDELTRVSLGETGFTMAASALRPLGHGVAIAIHSDRLAMLRAGLAGRWAAMLTAQDRQKFQPHVTIQNKVDAATARALLGALQPGFVPFAVQAVGLALWRYLGGPWAPIIMAPFAPKPVELPRDGQTGRE